MNTNDVVTKLWQSMQLIERVRNLFKSIELQDLYITTQITRLDNSIKLLTNCKKQLVKFNKEVRGL